MDPLTIISGISALGGLFGNRKKTNTQQSTSTSGGASDTNTHGYGTSRPELTQQQQDLLDQIVGKSTANLNEDVDLKGYQAGQTGQINNLVNIQKKAAEEQLAARGITGGPALATSQNNIDAGGFAERIKLAQGIPLLKNQIQQQKIASASDVFSRIPTETKYENYGNTQNQFTNTTNSSGSATDPGNMLGGLFGNLGQVLAYLYGQGGFGGNNLPGTDLPSARPNYGGR